MTDLEYIREKVDKILVQVTKTNGRVNNLEESHEDLREDVENLKEHQNQTKGRDNTLRYVMIGVATIVGYFIAHFISKI